VSERASLHVLAERAGIERSYRDYDGGECRVSDETLVALLSAMGLDGSGEERAREALHALDAEPDANATVEAGDSGCLRPEELLGERKAFGVWTHVYTLRSEASWGLGDCRDLTQLVEWAGRLGLDFVGINPLHATDNGAPEVSPYFPLSRLYGNPIYLHVDTMLARAGASETRARLDDRAVVAERHALGAAPRVDYARTWALKLPHLEAAHRSFASTHRDQGTGLGRAYAGYLREQGSTLEDFAVFSALREWLLGQDRAFADATRWPAQYRDRKSSAVAAFATERAERVDLHRYLQFELTEQLASCQAAARSAGMAIGLYGDLAVGDAPGSAEVWARPELYARTVSLGAPPDPFSSTGQSWGLLPVRPLAMQRDGYRHYQALLRQAFRNVGALRIDHVMGLERQFWVPSGATARDGAYVRFPLQDLLGVVTRESRGARALVIGEDLGLVPDGFRERMAERGLLRSQVLYFERDWAGEALPPDAYARGALVTTGTHDLAPLLGFLQARDLELLDRIGRFDDPAARERAFADRTRFRASLLGLFHRHGLLSDQPDLSPVDLVRAAYRLLARTPAQLVGIALDDLCLEEEALNVPAVSVPGAPNWSRRSRLRLEELDRDEDIARLVREIVAARG
jgi:4-alpha-glucanotransferase